MANLKILMFKPEVWWVGDDYAECHCFFSKAISKFLNYINIIQTVYIFRLSHAWIVGLRTKNVTICRGL